jgi:predicted N-acyltransferase
MKPRLLDLDTIDHAAWNEFVRTSVNGTALDTIEWAEAWRTGCPGARPFFWVLEDSDIQAGILIIEISKAGFRNYYSLPYGDCGGIIIRDQTSDAKDQKSQLIDCLNRLTRGRWGTITFSDFHGETDGCKLETFGFKKTMCVTHVLDLCEDPQAAFKRLSPSKRRLVKQAEKNGVHVRDIRDEKDVEECYSMLQDTAQRHNIRSPRLPLGFYLSVFRKRGDSLRWRVATRENKNLATTIHFACKNTITYWDGGSYTSELQYRPNDALIWDAITWGSEHGYKSYNLGGSPSPGLVRFKEGWGAKEKHYSTYSRKSRPFRILKSLQETFHK